MGVAYPIFVQTDPFLGVDHIPHAAGWADSEGRVYLRFNSDGLRGGAEYAVPKPPDTVRIALLGDSFAEAGQVDEEKAFGRVIERNLAKLPVLRGSQLEVINFGVSGYGTGLELLTLRRKVWKYEPDYVLLAFHTGNDITDNHRALASAEYIPYFVLENDELKLDKSYLASQEYRVRSSAGVKLFLMALNRSSTLQLANRARLAVRSRRAADAIQRAVPESVLIEPGIDERVFLPPADDEWADAWRVTEALLARVHQEVTAGGADFFVVTLSNGSQVTPDRQAREAFRGYLRVENLFYPDRRVSEVGSRVGFPVLNLAPVFQKYADSTGRSLHGFNETIGTGHWNEDGHALAGKHISTWLSGHLGREPNLASDPPPTPNRSGSSSLHPQAD